MSAQHKLRITYNLPQRDVDLIKRVLTSMAQMATDGTWTAEQYDLELTSYMKFLKKEYGDGVQITMAP